MSTPTVGLVVRMEAKPGKEAELESFLTKGLSMVLNEPLTSQWFALKVDSSHFLIVDAFAGKPGRDAHLNGDLAKALFGKVDELMTGKPQVEMVDVLAAKLSA
jgi:quinol monooxygenase YgiN